MGQLIEAIARHKPGARESRGTALVAVCDGLQQNPSSPGAFPSIATSSHGASTSEELRGKPNDQRGEYDPDT